MAEAVRQAKGGGIVLRLVALGLVVAMLGLPLNHLLGFALAVASVVILATGRLTARPAAWLAAAAIAALVIGAQILLAPPLIDEGENTFLADGARQPLASVLPADVYRQMAAEFDALDPEQQRCGTSVGGCWRATGFPDRAYAFSADGVYDQPEFSRRVATIDFDNPVRLRLGFVNDLRYNWYAGVSDIQRATRNRAFWMGSDRWRLQMPWYVVYRLPAAYIGSQFCWRGEIMWERPAGHFDRLDHAAMACSNITPDDIGRRIFGIAVKPDSLAMRLEPPGDLRARRMAQQALMLVGVAGVLVLLLQIELPALIWPALLIGLALAVIALDDASFIGGVRPFDGGDDGLFYDGVGRTILQHVLHGNWLEALRGGESVFYYGGPGLRYFRAIEKLVFGETYLGYLSLVLLFPFALFMLWRRFLSPRWALCLTLLFVATPAGILFGTSFIQYASLAARGFADPAAYILFVCGLIPLVGASAAGPQTRFLGAIGAGLLLACAIFMKPIVAPAVGVLLAGAGIAALSQGKWSRLAGLCFGFAPVLLMPLHNWYFGGRLVLFSSNANLPSLLVMPPRAWGAALCELLHGQWTAPHLRQAAAQILGWLSGPSHIAALAPLGAVAVVLVAFVALGNRFKGWLRLIALATLTQHAVALFYATTPRYHFLTWLLTLTVVCVWLREAALPWLCQRHPGLWQRAAGRPETMRLARWIAALQRTTERAPAMPAGA